MLSTDLIEYKDISIRLLLAVLLLLPHFLLLPCCYREELILSSSRGQHHWNWMEKILDEYLQNSIDTNHLYVNMENHYVTFGRIEFDEGKQIIVLIFLLYFYCYRGLTIPESMNTKIPVYILYRFCVGMTLFVG